MAYQATRSARAANRATQQDRGSWKMRLHRVPPRLVERATSRGRAAYNVEDTMPSEPDKDLPKCVCPICRGIMSESRSRSVSGIEVR